MMERRSPEKSAAARCHVALVNALGSIDTPSVPNGPIESRIAPCNE